MKEAYFDIFNLCFSNMELSYERFSELLHNETSVFFEEYEDNEVCAFAIVESFAIRLICVNPSKQGRGIGTGLSQK